MPPKPHPQFWIIVTSKNHVVLGRDGGFCMANHGKKAPLQRMKKGDGVVFYSPRLVWREDTPCQAFTAIGRISDDAVYQYDMGNGFVPYRRNLSFATDAEDAPIQPLIDSLDFIENKKSWGFKFRFGFFEVGEADFQRIAEAMKATF